MVDVHDSGADQAIGSSAVGVGGWLGKAGQEVGPSDSCSFPVLERVCVGEEELNAGRGCCGRLLCQYSQALYGRRR